MGKVGWSDLPEELVGLIADRLSPNIDLLRLRSICKPWRSAVATKKRFPNRFKRILLPFNRSRTELFPTTFFRVTLPSSSSSRPNKGWLIKTRQVSESSKNTLLSPLYRHLITPSHKTLDLLKFGVSEIRQSYNVKYSNKRLKKYSNKRLKKPRNSSRAVLVDNLFFVVDYNKQIWCCKLGEENSRWTRIMNEESGGLDFSDIILHRGLIYALDLKGAIWWIHISELNIFQFTVASPMDDNMIDDCKDKRLVEYCGDLCVVHRFCDEVEYIERTLCFKVYKMDEELVEWVEMKSLGNKALIVATDSCFTVLASEYNGCLENSIYFTDDDDQYFTSGMKVFKLDDATIINMIDSSSQSCFHMFSPHFL